MSVDLIILTGFLGSGKTTLLVDFLQQEGARDTAVIVNEVGEIGVDGAIIADGSSGIPMTLLANGCICCSLRSDLVHTITALLDQPRLPGMAPLKRIILEASGLARPGPILASLTDPELQNRNLRICVISTYDCETGALNVETFDESASQLVAAQRIIFTKIDKVGSATLAYHQAIARSVNPLAEFVMHASRAIVVSQTFRSMPARDAIHRDIQALRQVGRSSTTAPHPRIFVMTGSPAKDNIAWTEIAQWLDDVAACCGEKLLRLKALIYTVDCVEPILIQSVGTTYSAPRRMLGQVGTPGVCVLITRDIAAEEINRMLPDGVVRLSLSIPAARQKTKIFHNTWRNPCIHITHNAGVS